MTRYGPIRWCLHACRLTEAESQVSPAERQAVARYASGRRSLVEIGVMQGASTRLLRSAMDPDGELTGIDPHPPGRLGINFDRQIARSEIRRSSRGRARLLHATSTEAACTWSTPLDFIFIDGDHSWSGIDEDWRNWSGHVVRGGIVALHDSRPSIGRPVFESARYLDEVIKRDKRFEVLHQVETLTVLVRA